MSQPTPSGLLSRRLLGRKVAVQIIEFLPAAEPPRGPAGGGGGKGYIHWRLAEDVYVISVSRLKTCFSNEERD